MLLSLLAGIHLDDECSQVLLMMFRFLIVEKSHYSTLFSQDTDSCYKVIR